jgi:hypothetical protein
VKHQVGGLVRNLKLEGSLGGVRSTEIGGHDPFGGGASGKEKGRQDRRTKPPRRNRRIYDFMSRDLILWGLLQ